MNWWYFALGTYSGVVGLHILFWALGKRGQKIGNRELVGIPIISVLWPLLWGALLIETIEDWMD